MEQLFFVGGKYFSDARVCLFWNKEVRETYAETYILGCAREYRW